MEVRASLFCPEHETKESENTSAKQESERCRRESRPMPVSAARLASPSRSAKLDRENRKTSSCADYVLARFIYRPPSSALIARDFRSIRDRGYWSTWCCKCFEAFFDWTSYKILSSDWSIKCLKAFVVSLWSHPKTDRRRLEARNVNTIEMFRMILLDRDVESRQIFRPVKLIRSRSISAFERLTFFSRK